MVSAYLEANNLPNNFEGHFFMSYFEKNIINKLGLSCAKHRDVLLGMKLGLTKINFIKLTFIKLISLMRTSMLTLMLSIIHSIDLKVYLEVVIDDVLDNVLDNILCFNLNNLDVYHFFKTNETA